MSGMLIDQEYEVVRIDGDHDPLREHPQNPNQGVEEVVDESIDHNGWYGAVLAQKSTGYILAGNTRYRSAKKRRAKEIPVIWKDVDDEAALKILLVDNESARQATMDEEQLTLLLESLESLDGTGFDSVLHPLEASIEGDRGGGVDPDPTSNGEGGPAPDDASDGPPGPDDIPDDVYTPEYGVMVVCDSEEDQAAFYKWLQSEVPDRTMRVVAV